jgi:ribosomal protein S18 acetylase RimI-like enzyme
MGLTYFKRYRMEIDVRPASLVLPELPPGYSVCPWDESCLEAHVEAKYQAFAREIDALVFPSLASREGCLRLMREITGRSEFVPEATWLLQYRHRPTDAPISCGTIQGIRVGDSAGSVQNVGVVAEHRGLGLGTYLLGKSLAGFRQAGIRRVSLEVTARNHAARRLYRRLGFLRIRTVYKTAQVAFA